MDDEGYLAFSRFAKKYRGKFKSISAATRRELEPDEVEIEAWILSKGWELKGVAIRFDDFEYVDKLFAHLYKNLVDFTDKKVRTSVRLDHWAYGDNPDSDAHPLMNKLAAAESDQPLEILLAIEDAAEQPPEPGPHETRAGAYLYLIRHYDNCMKEVANHLMISLSYCYYRLSEAREMAFNQCALLDTLGKPPKDFIPGPWRAFRLIRPWVQMELDLLSGGSLWEDCGMP